MHKCTHCGVQVQPHHTACPLCGKHLAATAQISDYSYPQYPNPKRKKRLLAQKILYFLMIFVTSICVFINAFTWQESMHPWSVLVVSGLIFIWVFLKGLFSEYLNLGGKILIQYAAISSLLVIIDIYTGFSKWSTTYAIPFLTVALVSVFILTVLTGKKRFREYSGYLLTTFFLSLCPILFFAFSLTNQMWTCLVAILYCFLTIAGFFIFADDAFKSEIKKRFHF